MRFGVCTDVQLIAEVEKLGFDYIEIKLNALAALSEEEFAKVCALVETCSIGVERCCLLLPKSMAIIGSEYDEEALRTYLHHAYGRMQKLGANLVVFGSGKSRAIPEGMSHQQAFADLVEVTKIIGNIANEYGIQIAIEPLNRKETNLINSLREGSALQAMVNLPNVGLLADSFHMCTEQECFEDIALVSPLMHAHVATLEGRKYPICVDENIAAFFKALRMVGYDGSVSIEGKSDDWHKDSGPCLSVLRSL